MSKQQDSGGWRHASRATATGVTVCSSAPDAAGRQRITSLGFMLLTIVLLTGCMHQPVIELPLGSPSLQRWLDDDLAPYLIDQLGKHPRFKGEAVVLVQLDGQDIQSDIDGLTRQVRDRLMDRLLAEPGITLPWQPQKRPVEHHRRLDNLQCRRTRDASYTIGIEITRLTGVEHRVSVRALDLEEESWISGFGRSWTGRLSTDEIEASQTREPDESLRGLRVLPFDSREPDLAATYLANNLSCLLRERDTEDFVIHVEALKSDQASLRILPALIGNNLSRFREVRVTDDAQEANFRLRGEAYEIDDDMHQVWVVLNPVRSGEHLAGMDTSTWIRTRTAPTQTTAREPLPQRQALPAGPEIVSLGLTHREQAGHGCPATHRQGVGDEDGCRVLELSVRQSHGIFVFMHAPDHGISRLSAGRCVIDQASQRDRPDRIRYAIPAARIDQSEWPTIYAIAVGDLPLAQRFDEHLGHLPDACAETTGLHSQNGGSQWLDRLDSLIANNGERTDWTARRIR